MRTPPTRTTPLDAAAVREHVETLSVALATWANRDDTQPQPHVCRAANTAVASIDVMLAELHQLRGHLVTEIRASDDATNTRIDAMLARGTRSTS